MGEPEHALLALGTPGGERCVDGTELVAGVHLLWTVDVGLGFPGGGYDVARREHRGPEWFCLPFDQAGLPASGETDWSWGSFTLAVTPGRVSLDHDACGASPGLALPGARTLTVGRSRVGVAVRASGTGAPPVVEVADGAGTVLGRRTGVADGGGWSVELWASGITEVRITGTDLVVCTLCVGEAVPQEGWRPLTSRPILLPVVPEGTRNAPELIHGRAATLARARSRLPAALPPRAADRLAEDFADAPRELVDLLLRGGPGARLPASATAADGARTAPRLGLSAATVLALAATDPNVARMLGLTWHDPPLPGRWDYRVVAHYGSTRFPAESIRLDGLTRVGALPGTVVVGGVTVVGSAGLAVLFGSTALRVHPPMPGTRAGLILPPDVRSVRLRFAPTGDGDGFVFTGRRADRAVATVTGTGGPVLIEDDRALDTVTWDTGPLDLVEVELSDQPGTVGDVAAYAWNLAAADPTPVRALAIVDVAADAATRPPEPDGRLPRCAGVLGVDWAQAVDVHDAGQPVRARIATAGPAATEAGAADGPFTIVDTAQPAGSHISGQVGTWPGPDVPRQWIRPVEEAGWYAVRVDGVDAFGRLGAWTPARTVHVGAAAEPGVPDAVTARYLDPADPTLTDADLARCGGTPGLLVGWTWPAGRRMPAPADGSGEFRVYLRRGDPNLVTGSVLDVDRDTDRSRLRTDLDRPGAAGALTGQLLRVGGDSFPILDHDSTWFDVAHLTTPLRRPGTGAFTITLAPGAAAFVGFEQPADFVRRAAVVPSASAPPLTTTVRTVRPTGDGAELTLADAVTVDDENPLPGLLLSRGVGYPVTAQHDGSAVIGIGAARQPGGALLLPAVGDACTLWSGTRYEAWLPGVQLEPGEAEAFAVAFVGVAASDGDPLVADDPRWDAPGRGGLGGRPGREGPTGRAARVAVPRRDSPPALPVPRPDGDIPSVMAEPADWYGRAHHAVTLDPVAGVVGYRVLRASTAALFAHDQGLRRAGREPYAADPFPEDAAWLAEHHPTLSTDDMTADPATLPGPVAAEVEAAWREWSGWFYPGRSNRQVMELSDVDANAEVFQPAHAGTVPGPSYRDTLDGRGAGRFLHRVRTVDAAGASGPLSPTFPIVELRDVTPPKSPTVLSAVGDENAVVLTWRAGTEPDLAGYRIWRSARPAELADVRRVPAYAEVAAVSTPSVTWTDGELRPGREWYYRLAAVDLAGNVSAPAAVVRARPIDTEPPEPPVWRTVTRLRGNAVALAWLATEDGVACMVERRRDRERAYTARTGWLAPVRGARGFAWRDDHPGAGAVSYRIRARDVMGNEQRFRWNPVTVPGEDT